jgi:GAF domain-containing protein
MRREPVNASELAETPQDPEQRARLAAALASIGAYVAIPLRVAARGAESGSLVGVITLGRKVTQTRITYDELSLVSLVVHQVGISLMNASLHEEQITTRLLEEEVTVRVATWAGTTTTSSRSRPARWESRSGTCPARECRPPC